MGVCGGAKERRHPRPETLSCAASVEDAPAAGLREPAPPHARAVSPGCRVPHFARFGTHAADPLRPTPGRSSLRAPYLEPLDSPVQHAPRLGQTLHILGTPSSVHLCQESFTPRMSRVLGTLAPRVTRPQILLCSPVPSALAFRVFAHCLWPLG